MVGSRYSAVTKALSLWRREAIVCRRDGCEATAKEATMKHSPAFIVRHVHSRPRHPARSLPRWSVGAAALGALVLVIAGCGSSGKPSSSSSSPSTAQAAGHPGGTWTILANSNFGVADPAQNYTL